jgi:hypothetical protein
MLRRLGLIAVCACTVASLGCDGGRMPDTAPSPPPPLATVSIEFGGQVVNAETGGAVANVRVSASALSSSGGGLREASGDLATSAGDGTFTFTIDQLPSDWRLVGLKFTGPDGYDDRGGRLEPTAAPCRISPCWAVADRPAIPMYPTLVIRPGESIDVRVQPGVNACAFGGGFDCRRVLVEASPSEPVELEIVARDASKPMGLVESDWSEEPVLRLTVAGGVAYVYGAGTARLTARR